MEITFNQVCKDRDQAECWYLGLTALISAPCTPLISAPINNRRINSCTNSPPSYIQQRSRLFAVHDRRNFTKVRSGIHEWMIFMQELGSFVYASLTLLVNFLIPHKCMFELYKKDMLTMSHGISRLYRGYIDDGWPASFSWAYFI